MRAIVEAIHPRGQQTQTRVKPKPARQALTKIPGKTLVSKINFLVDSLPDLTNEQAFESDRANKAFFAFSALHHRSYKGAGLTTQIEGILKAVDLLPTVVEELDKLYKKKLLPGVVEKDIETFRSVAGEVQNESASVRELMNDVGKVKADAYKLGFGSHMKE